MKEEKRIDSTDSGQVLVLVLLIMAVGLTVGVALVSRSVTGLKVTSQEEESARAFSVAEAGLEQAFLTGATTVTVGSGAGYTATVTESIDCKGEDTFFDFNGQEFAAGKAATLWLVGHDDATGEPDPTISFPYDEEIIVCWGDGDLSPFAVEIVLFYQENGADFQTKKMAVDGDAIRAVTNRFEGADPSVPSECGGFQSSKQIDLDDPSGWNIGSNDTLYAMRLRPVYNESVQPIAVLSDGVDFPAQGEGYESTATVGAGPGSTVRLKQCQFYKAPPDIFDYALFSESDLSH